MDSNGITIHQLVTFSPGKLFYAIFQPSTPRLSRGDYLVYHKKPPSEVAQLTNCIQFDGNSAKIAACKSSQRAAAGGGGGRLSGKKMGNKMEKETTLGPVINAR